MKDSPTYLIRNRFGIYYFRIRIPKDIKHFYPNNKQELKRSLNTDSRRKAERRARNFWLRCQAHFEHLRQENGMEVQDRAPVTEIKADDISALKEEQNFKEIGRVLSHLYQKSGTTISSTSFNFDFLGGFHELLRKHKNVVGKIKEAKTELDREKLKEEFLQSILPDLKVEIITAMKEGSSIQNAPLLSDVIQKFIEYKKKNWSPKSQEENEKGFALFLRIVKDQPFNQIKHEEINTYVDSLIKLPANLNKRKETRGKPIEEILKLNLPPRATQTINKDITRISALYEWAETRGWTDKNYAKNRTIKKKKNDPTKRLPFTNNDLEALLFNDEFLQKSNRKRLHDYYFWLPLLAMYTGARINEICQLHLEDIYEEDGVPIFHITNEGKRRLKNVASKRKVPIHKHLLNLGLLNRVKRLKDAGEERLFPELKNKRDGYGAAASKWFGDYKLRCGIEDKRKVFHCFRNTVLDHLKQKGIEINQSRAIVGHKDDSMSYGTYAQPYKPKALVKVVNQIDYDLDLSLLMTPQVNPDFPKKKSDLLRTMEGL